MKSASEPGGCGYPGDDATAAPDRAPARNRHPVRGFIDPPRLADWLIVILLLGLTGLSLRFSSLRSDIDSIHTRREPDLLLVVLSVAMILPLLWRRSHPTLVLILSGTVLTISLLVGFPVTPGQFAVVVAEYSVAAYAGRRQARLALLFTAAGIALSFVLDFRGVETIANVFGVYVFYGTAWLLGDVVRSHRERVAELTARTRAMEVAQAERELNAVRRERVRIARELHDVIAHSMSVMVIHSGAVRREVEERDPDLATRLGVIETTGRNALGEMRLVVGALRESDPAGGTIPAPQPRCGDLAPLIQTFREAGLDIEDLDLSGPAGTQVAGDTTDVPDTDLGTDRWNLGNLDGMVPAVVAMTAYRIIQEALTNVLRHAGPARTRVSVAVRDGALTLAVTDDGRGAAARDDGSGNGILGMRERVQILGGDLVTGPRSGGGFEVRASIPLRQREESGIGAPSVPPLTRPHRR